MNENKKGKQAHVDPEVVAPKLAVANFRRARDRGGVCPSLVLAHALAVGILKRCEWKREKHVGR